MKRNQCGFTAVAGLLVLVIVAIIGGTGWYVINANKNTDDTLNKSGLGTLQNLQRK
jgi:Tfp pilus assembly protein PilX